MSYIRAGVTSEWIAIAKGESDEEFFTKNIEMRGKNNWYATVGDDKGLDLDWKEENGEYKMTVTETGSNKPIGNRITENLYTLDSDNRAFLFTQISGGNIDFAAVVKIWRESIKMDVPVIAISGAEGSEGGVKYQKLNGIDNAINQYAMVFCVEVSWPAQGAVAKPRTACFPAGILQRSVQKANSLIRRLSINDAQI